MENLFIALVNNPSQATIIGGLIVVIILLVRQNMAKPKGEETDAEGIPYTIKRLATNDLHYLPEMLDTLKRMEDKLDRNFEKVNGDTAYIRGRLNGHDK